VSGVEKVLLFIKKRVSGLAKVFLLKATVRKTAITKAKHTNKYEEEKLNCDHEKS
jgi:hypothetical protein